MKKKTGAALLTVVMLFGLLLSGPTAAYASGQPEDGSQSTSAASRAPLLDAINEALAIDLGGYTAESAEALQQAIADAQALYNDENAGQEALDAQRAALRTAAEALAVPAPAVEAGGNEEATVLPQAAPPVAAVDKAGLSQAVEAALRIDAGLYTDASYKALQAVLFIAQGVCDNAGAVQSDVDGQCASLQAAINALVAATAEKTGSARLALLAEGEAAHEVAPHLREEAVIEMINGRPYATLVFADVEVQELRAFEDAAEVWAARVEGEENLCTLKVRLTGEDTEVAFRLAGRQEEQRARLRLSALEWPAQRSARAALVVDWSALDALMEEAAQCLAVPDVYTAESLAALRSAQTETIRFRLFYEDSATQAEVNEKAEELQAALDDLVVMEKPPLEDGLYTVDVKLRHASTEQDSMGNAALVQTAALEVTGGQGMLTMSFQSMTFAGLNGYLAEFNRMENIVFNQYNYPVEYDKVPATVLDSFEVEDSYNHPQTGTDERIRGKAYPKELAIPVDLHADFTWVHVYVPVMGEAAAGDQVARLTLYLDSAEETLTGREKLSQLLEEAEAVAPAGYTAESFAALEAAIGEARIVYENADAAAAEIEGQIAALEEALAGLDRLVDKSALEAALASAARLDSGLCTRASAAAWAAALAEAQDACENTVATGEEVAAAVEALEEARRGLVAQAPTQTGSARIEAWHASLDTRSMMADLLQPEAVLERINGYTYATITFAPANIMTLDIKGTGLGDLNTCSGDERVYATEVERNEEEGIYTLKVRLLEENDTGLEMYVHVMESTQTVRLHLTDVEWGGESGEPVDRTALQAAVEEAGRVDGSLYTALSYGALQDALEAAEAVLEDDAASQGEVDDALAALKAALDSLVEKQAQQVDKTLLAARVAEAGAIGASGYTAATYKALSDALADARELLDDDAAGQEAVNSRVIALRAAVGALVKTPVSGQLADGSYTAGVKLLHAAQNATSMGNAALGQTARITVANGSATACLDFQKMSLSGFSGYLAEFNRLVNIKFNSNGYPISYERVPAGVVSSYSVADGYNHPQTGSDERIRGQLYPRQLSLPVDLDAAYIWVHVYVPVMGELDSGDQIARLVIDRNSLVREANDTAALKAMIAGAKKAVPGEASALNWAALQSAIVAAEDTLARTAAVAQAALDAQTAALEARMQALSGTVAEVDKTALQARITAGRAYKEADYTADSFKGLKTALAGAEAALLSTEVTQAEVDGLTAALDAAIKGLVKASTSGGQQTVDKAALRVAINHAKAIVKGNYTDVSWLVLRNTITTATSILHSQYATQGEVNAQVTALEGAIRGLTLRPAGAVDPGSILGGSAENTAAGSGKYQVRVDLWHAQQDKASMGNDSLNHTALIEVAEGAMVMSVSVHPMQVGTVTASLESLQVRQPGGRYQYAEVISRGLAGGKPSAFRFQLPGTDTYIPVKIDPKVEVMGNEPIDARLRISWDTLVEVAADTQLSTNTALAAGTLPGGKENAVISDAADLYDDATGVRVQADENVLPEGTTMEVTAITSGQAYNRARDVLRDVGQKFVLYDITLRSPEGEVVQPNGKVKVSIPLPGDMDGERAETYRINDDASKTLLQSAVEEGLAVYHTNHFSLYAVVERDDGQALAAGDTDGVAALGGGETSLAGPPEAGGGLGYLWWLLGIAAAAAVVTVLVVRRKLKAAPAEPALVQQEGPTETPRP